MAAHFLGVAFMVVNAIRNRGDSFGAAAGSFIIDREEKLYRVAFSSIDKKGS